MMKYREADDVSSCWNRAKRYEMVFVLLERDAAVPSTIRHWIAERIRLGRNQPGDDQLVEAELIAKQIELSLRHAGKLPA
jgi:hypothetical protein